MIGWLILLAFVLAVALFVLAWWLGDESRW
jgi:hypothetical protein